jgi:hypothetical protein
MMSPTRCRAGAAAGLAILAIAGCRAGSGGEGAAVAAKDEPAWRARLTQERAEKDHDFATAVTSPVAAIERFAPIGPAYLALDGDKLQADDQPGPASRVAFRPTDGSNWSWQVAGGEVRATAADGKRAITPGTLSEPTLFRLSERITALAQIAGGGFVITGFDARRKELLEFKQLAYFAPDPRFAVTAKVERLAAPDPIKLATTRGLTKSFVRYAMLRFELDGTRYTLTAFRPAGSTGRELFVPFRDATSGNETYGAARFIDLEEPDRGASMLTLDFNEAYNPLCAYSPAWNCPIPPPENILKVSVTAGERTYGH